MMRTLRTAHMMIIAFVLLLAGACVPFLMMMRIIESTFFLNFLAYIASMGGLILGIIGVVLYVNEKSDDDEY